MKIVFLLPGHGSKPIGGHKIIYEYANRFFDNGDDVLIVYGGALLFARYSLLKKVYIVLRFLYFKILNLYTPYKWFKLNKGIKLAYAWDYTLKDVLNADAVIATSVETAISLKHIKIECSKYYFIQGFEDWNVSKEELMTTWTDITFEKIFVSDWLKDIGDKHGISSQVVYNGFDINTFYLQTPLEERYSNSLCTIYHSAKSKGFEQTFNVIIKLREIYPDLVINIFGTDTRPSFLPDWFLYTQMPAVDEIREIYNKSSIFIATSHNEGWGLTIGEAMLCGCAVACTNNNGYRIMAKHNYTALLSDIFDDIKLFENVRSLIENEELRIRLAKQALQDMKNFNIENSYHKFRNIILNK